MSKIKVGDVLPVNNGGYVTVIEYVNSRNITVEHNDSHKHRVSVRADNLLGGKVRNLYLPGLCSKGYFGVGEFASSVKDIRTVEHIAWSGMIRRCYDEKMLKRNPTYLECSVCPEWLNFQNFASWYTSNKYYGLGYHLDKDILVKGNKIYSPEMCVLVPKDINNLLEDRAAMRGEFPIGVCFNKQINKFVASRNDGAFTKYIGVFKCPNEAHDAYVVSKEAYVKSKALEYKDFIDSRVFDALMCWTVN